MREPNLQRLPTRSSPAPSAGLPLIGSETPREDPPYPESQCHVGHLGDPRYSQPETFKRNESESTNQRSETVRIPGRSRFDWSEAVANHFAVLEEQCRARYRPRIYAILKDVPAPTIDDVVAIHVDDSAAFGAVKFYDATIGISDDDFATSLDALRPVINVTAEQARIAELNFYARCIGGSPDDWKYGKPEPELQADADDRDTVYRIGLGGLRRADS